MTTQISHDFSAVTQVGELPYADAAFDLETRGAVISRYFKNYPDVPGVIIMKGATRVNTLSQASFLRVMSRPYGLERFTVRPIEALLECVTHAPMLVLPAECPIQDAIAHCLARASEEIYEPFLVENAAAGTIRMVGFPALLLASSQVFALRNRQLAAEITARQETEKALLAAKREADTANRVKGEFMANMSHEIRTPMNGIMGMTELVLDTELTTEQRNYLALVRQSANSLMGIINDILDFSKIEAGKIQLEHITFSLRELVAEIIKPFGIQVGQKSLELVADLPASVPDELVGDPVRLRQVLVNLLGNAIKFTQKGEITLEVRSPLQQNGHVQLRFGVADTGIGIPADQQSAIFSPFVQADGSTTRRFGGTGLGLAISSGIVEQMGGRLKVESEPGRGSRFEFTVRFGRGASPTLPVTPAHMERLRGLRTLVVDDNHTNRRVLEEMTRQWGLLTVAVNGGHQALHELEWASQLGTPFGLVLLDAMMPEMDGFMMMEELLRRRPARLPTVIMLSSAAQPQALEHARELGIAGVLNKPVCQADLLNTILTILSQFTPKPAPNQAPLGKVLRPLRLLLVEDNPTNQLVGRTFLTQRGHEVVLAGNGMEAVAAVNGSTFDVILMDIQMPDMDGVEASARIRKLQQSLGQRQTPIVALTARAMKEEADRYQAAGMEAFIAKPFARDEFLRIVERVGLEGRS